MRQQPKTEPMFGASNQYQKYNNITIWLSALLCVTIDYSENCRRKKNVHKNSKSLLFFKSIDVAWGRVLVNFSGILELLEKY